MSYEFDLVERLSEHAKNRSKIYNKGHVEYAFSLGWFTGDVKRLLEDMQLTKKQLKFLENRVAQLDRMLEKDQAKVNA